VLPAGHVRYARPQRIVAIGREGVTRMSPATAACLQELRSTLDATFSVVADDGAGRPF